MITFKQFLTEEREYWSDYPGQPGGRKFVQSLKSDVASTFKVPERSISVKQFLPEVGTYRQRWTMKLTKKFEGSEDTIKDMLIKFLVADLKKHFDDVKVHDSWMLANGSAIVVILEMKHKWKNV